MAKALELFERDIADAKRANSAAIVDILHRPPSGPIVTCQPSRIFWTMQQIGIDSLDVTDASFTCDQR